MAQQSLNAVLSHLRRLCAAQANHDLHDGELLERFATGKEESAFTLLVQRHGPMVLSVCQRVLHDQHAAEDAFQATFLVLVRRSASVRQGSLASWLYGVARRVALHARTRDRAQRSRERQVRQMPARDFLDDLTWQEVRAVLDEEIGALPESLRAAIVLCHLEGKSYSQAARELGWPKTSLARRLTQARDMLRQRLARRGITLSAAALATALCERAAGAALPALLTLNTVKAAVLFATGKAAAVGALSSQAVALAEESMKGIFGLKSAVFAVLLTGGIVAGGVGLAGYQAALEKPAIAQKDAQGQVSRLPETPSSKPNKSLAMEQEETITINGKVLDPGGKPFAGAKVFFARYIVDTPPPTSAQDTSDGAGRFRLRVSRSGYRKEYERTSWLRGAVVAVGKGRAFGWVGSDNAEKLTNVTVQLAKDVPVEGRVVDLQGKPIPGVKVSLRDVHFREQGDGLRGFVEALKSKPTIRTIHGPAWPAMRIEPSLLGMTGTTATDGDGRFRLTGICGECLVVLRFEHPTIEAAEVFAMTRPGPTIHVPPRKNDLPRGLVCHGATFNHVAAPTRPIEGIVRDKDTGKPLPGVTIKNQTFGAPGARIVPLQTSTDAEGRYRIVGLSMDARHELLAVPPPGQPYLCAAMTSNSDAANASDPVRVDFALKRGVLIRGRVRDKETGQPVPARVVYYALVGNPFLREAPGFQKSNKIEVPTGADGSFTLLGLSGRGLIAATVADRWGESLGDYLIAVGADGIKGARNGDFFVGYPSYCYVHAVNAVVEVNPAKDADAIVRDVMLDPGKTVTGTIVDPGGRPVKGASIQSVFTVMFRVNDLPTADFRILGVDPKHPRAFYFRDGSKKLGAALLFKGDEAMPVIVRLQKCATITGRLVDADGRPRAAYISGSIPAGQLGGNIGAGTFKVQAGKDGRFRIEGVIPGLKIELWAGDTYSSSNQKLIPELTLREGEVKDLGDLQRKTSE